MEHSPSFDADALIDELAEIRENGMAFNIRGIDVGLNSVAVAVSMPGRSSPIGGINLAGAAADLPLERLRSEVGPVLRQVAAEIMPPTVEQQ